MTKKQSRIVLILAALTLGGVALWLISFALKDSIVFFYTPSEIAQKHVAAGTRFRLGGLVEQGSLVKGANGEIAFAITDMTRSVKVSYKGLLPDLFREGQGVVTEGQLAADGIFRADTVLAKHDEKYMPKDVVDKLKAQGQWRQPTP